MLSIADECYGWFKSVGLCMVYSDEGYVWSESD